MSSNVAPIEADVVILGGGIQGVWLLADLVDRQYQALLLEREHAGAGQTGHSHVFLHRGHMHASMKIKDSADAALDRIKLFQDAFSRWEQELQKAGRLNKASTFKSSFYIGFKKEQKATDFKLLCDRARLDCSKTEADATSFSSCPHMFEAEGICLESNSVLDSFLNQNGLRTRTAHCTGITIQNDGQDKFRINVTASDSDFVIIARALVLAAGAGNEALVREILPDGGIQLDESKIRQQTVKTYMLAINAPAESSSSEPALDLPKVCGMFPDSKGIFIAHRINKDRSVTWLIADRQRHYVSVPGHWTGLDSKQWFARVMPELEVLMPWLLQTPQKYQWGIYEAAKAEALTLADKPRSVILPQRHTVIKESGRNLWVTWPGFLTLAPLVASDISNQVAASFSPTMPAGGSLPGGWNPIASPIKTGQDRWCTTPLLGWNEFVRCYA